MHPVIFFVLLMLAFGIAGRIDADSYEAMSPQAQQHASTCGRTQ